MAIPKPGPHYTIDRIDQAIRVAHADLTWHSEHMSLRIWQAIDQLLDQRNNLTRR